MCTWGAMNGRTLMNKFLVPLLNIVRLKKKSIAILMVMADALLSVTVLKITLVNWKAYVKREQLK